MDWSFHADKTRAADKIYEDSYVSAWEEDETGKTLVPAGFKLGEEKQRTIDCYQSNKYNITQSIAEAFEVFCHYEYKCDQNGRFVREYYDTKIDENGNEVNDKVWTGRKVVFYNYAIKQENPFVVDYQTNLQNISRTSDSTEIYTKMYVTPSQSDAMENGYITIADTKANPLMDEFILNFDYFDSINAISAYQKQFIEKYKTEIRRLNLALKELAPSINTKTVLLNEYKAQAALADKQKQSAQQEYNDYDALRNNEFIERQVDRTKVNPVSIIFVDEGSVLKGALHFDGVDSSSIKLYYTRDCEDKEDNLINVEDRPIIVTKKVPNIPEANKNRFYAYKDQYGQVLCLYCHPANEHVESNKNSLYATLSYYPVLKYDSICASLKLTEEQYTLLEEEYIAKQEQTQKELEELEAKQREYLDKKDKLNNELERILGPLLREGYWTPDEYQDPRQDYSVDYTMKGALNQFDVPAESGFFFDTELFDYEDKEYYEITEDVGQIEKKYFPYLPLNMSDTGTVQKWIADERDISKLNLRVKKNVYEATIAETWVERFDVGNKLKFTYNGKTYYFTVTLASPVVENDKICLYPDDTEENGFYITVKTDKQTVHSLDATVISNTDQNYDQIADITKLLSGGSSYFGDKILHLNAGYIFAYLKKKVQSGNSISYKAIPVILFNDDKNQGTYFDLEVPSANIITYCFEDDAGDYPFEHSDSEKFTLNNEKFPICYPRIVLREENVLSGSDALKIYPHTMAEFGKDEEGNELEEIDIEPLTKYYDYTVLMRDDDPHITFKINSKNFFNQISDYKYHINYQTSRANELLYLDAKNVSVDNAFPKYSYELSMSAVPDKMNYVRVGQMAYINDPLLGVHAASGYLNEITYDLSSPQNDEMVVQNYKTKFEDLFSVITASSEAMKQNERNYNIAAGKFEATGTISGDVLQQSINNNNLFLDYSLTGVEISPTEGIILTNTKPYANGAYGQVVLQGGGIFLSNSLDSNGRRIWSTGLTPNGLNAKLITAGQIDTNLIRIFAGDEMAFQWNSEGILAYKYDADGKAQRKNYVKFSQYGLQCIDENLNETFANYEEQNAEIVKDFPALEQGKAALVSLNWDGLTLRDKTGQTTLQLDKDSGSIFMTGTISSMNYSGDTVIGQGWQINQDGNAVFNNVHVRGTIAASVFEYKETSAVGGEMYLAPTAIIDSNISQNAEITLQTGIPFTIKLKGVKLIEEGKKHYGREWVENDIIGLTATVGTDDGLLYSIRNYHMRISNTDNDTILTGMINISGAEQNLFYDKNNTQIAVSEVIGKELIPSGQWNLIYLGTQNGNDVSKEGILFTAIADKAPYIDFYGANAEGINDNLPKVRIGNLDGLKDLPNLPEGLNPKGYGLYGENVHLRGGIYAEYGQIGNLKIIDNKIEVVQAANEELKNEDTSLTANGLSFGGKGLLLTGNNIKVYGNSKIELKTGTEENATNNMILSNDGIQILSQASISLSGGNISLNGGEIRLEHIITDEQSNHIILNQDGIDLQGGRITLVSSGSQITLSDGILLKTGEDSGYHSVILLGQDESSQLAIELNQYNNDIILTSLSISQEGIFTKGTKADFKAGEIFRVTGNYIGETDEDEKLTFEPSDYEQAPDVRIIANSLNLVSPLFTIQDNTQLSTQAEDIEITPESGTVTIENANINALSLLLNGEELMLQKKIYVGPDEPPAELGNIWICPSGSSTKIYQNTGTEAKKTFTSKSTTSEYYLFTDGGAAENRHCGYTLYNNKVNASDAGATSMSVTVKVPINCSSSGYDPRRLRCAIGWWQESTGKYIKLFSSSLNGGITLATSGGTREYSFTFTSTDKTTITNLVNSTQLGIEFQIHNQSSGNYVHNIPAGSIIKMTVNLEGLNEGEDHTWSNAYVMYVYL